MLINYLGQSGKYITQADIDLAVAHGEHQVAIMNTKATMKAGKDVDAHDIKKIDFSVDSEGYLGYEIEYECVPIDRIRRITGYLVGTTDRFNDAKKAEERDRVKHT